jgi:hypothetical protein
MTEEEVAACFGSAGWTVDDNTRLYANLMRSGKFGRLQVIVEFHNGRVENAELLEVRTWTQWLQDWLNSSTR